MKVRLRCGGLAVVTCLLFAGVAPSAQAASSLPWKDANPLERLFGKPRQQPKPRAVRRKPSHARKAPAKPAPIVAGVPIPNARPQNPGSAEDSAEKKSVEPASAVNVASDDKTGDVDGRPVPETADVPKPAAAPTKSEPGPLAPDSGEDEATKANAAKREKSPPAPMDVVQPGNSPMLDDPAKLATKPIDEIPVPVGRPDVEKADAQTPPPEKPTVEAAPVTPDDAPNSTEKLKARIATVSPAASVLAAAAVEDAKVCETELKKRGVDFTVGESISEGECGVLRPINVKRLSSGVKVSPDTQFLCRTALALDDWMTKGVLPAVKADLADRTLSEFRHASTYVCRPRASENGISEHARGSAIDIASFVFDKGEAIGVAAKEKGSPEAKFQAEIRAAACGPFKTVLGPGTDSDHATHFHLDIAARRNGGTYCK